MNLTVVYSCEGSLPLVFILREYFSAKAGNWDLFSVLWVLILSSVLGTIAPNSIYKEPRTHNGIKLINDCLGRVQLAFASFYLTALVTLRISGIASRRFFVVGVLISFIFLIFGLVLTKDQNRKIAQIHGKNCRPGEGVCNLPPLCWWQEIGFLLPNITLAALSLVAACCLAFSSFVIQNKLPGK